MNCSATVCTNCGQCKKEETTFEKAVRVFGGNRQKIKAIEEMSELIKELAKDDGTHESRLKVLEELKDVEHLIIQLKIIYNFTEDELLAMSAKKVWKLEQALEKELEK